MISNIYSSSFPKYFAHIHLLIQIILALRAQVQQGNMTQQQALDRLALIQASSAHSFQEQRVPQQLPPGFSTGGAPSGTTQQQTATLSSAFQTPQPGAQQVSRPSGDLADVPLPQLRALYTQLGHAVTEGERNLQATSSSGGGDIQRQQLQTKIELNKQRLRVLQEVITVKMRAR